MTDKQPLKVGDKVKVKQHTAYTRELVKLGWTVGEVYDVVISLRTEKRDILVDFVDRIVSLSTADLESIDDTD